MALNRRALALLAGGGLLAIAAAATALYLDRLDLARRAVAAWLKSSGTQGEVAFDAVGPTRLAGRLRLGPADHPDLTVDHAEIDYSLQSFLKGGGPRITAVRLRRPVLHARWRDGRLDLGGLDRLRARLPPQPGGGGPPPRIEVQDGLVRLATEFGEVRARGDALIEQGRPVTVSGTVTLPRLDRGGAQVEAGPIAVRARRSGARLLAAAEAPVLRLSGPAGSAEGGRLSLQADLAYDSLLEGRIDGRVTVEARLDRAQGGGAEARGLTASVQASDLEADLRARSLATTFHVRAAVGQARRGELALSGATAEGAGGLRLAGKALELKLRGHAATDGAWPALGPPAADDAPVFAAVKRALDRFHASATDAELTLARGRLSGRLLGPVRLEATSGGAVRLAPAGAGYRLEVGGGGLPLASARISRVTLQDGGLSATGSITAGFTLGLLEDARVRAQGILAVAGASARFTSPDCATLSAPRLELGENDAEAFTARLCPAAGPLLTVEPGRWTIAGTVRDAAAKVPTLQAALDGGSGPARLSGRGGELSAQATIAQGRVSDLARPLRFHPLRVTGSAALARRRATASLDFRTTKGFAVAHAEVSHDLDRMAGQALVSAKDLTFTPGGLQPSDLSPLTAALGEPASGVLDFSGRYDWASGQTTSAGRLTVRGLDFKSPLGAVSQASGEVAFTSLSPLAGATVGPVRAERITGLLPITDAAARASLEDEVLTVQDAHGSVGGGTVRAEAVVPLDKTKAVSGEVRLAGVQVRDLVESSPFGDRVDFTARISGRLPFELHGGQVRLSGGVLKADGPGRLSISRTALSGTSPPGAATSPMADFAYQAMENLAFDQLDATVDSRPDGRLGMLFHIKGRHDPPKAQQITLSWLDVIRRKFLDKPLPLPSGTEVNLTLDTTLNLDNLLKDYGDLRRLGGSAPVQPASPKVGADPVERPR